ncbi:MAG: hypothetical protein V1743_00035 [Nanoarchaeota archaeon]
MKTRFLNYVFVVMAILAMLTLIACTDTGKQPGNVDNNVYENSSSLPVGTGVPNSTGENIGGIFSDNDGEVKPPIIPN